MFGLFQKPKANAPPPKVLIVNTSADKFGKNLEIPTGLWLEETATPYYLMKEAGLDVVLASIKGGPIPLDHNSVSGDFFTEDCKRFMHDAEALKQLSHSVKLSDVEESAGGILAYSCIYISGGHGTCVDFIDCAELKRCIEAMYAEKKVVCADCHGPVAFKQCLKANGEPLTKGHVCTGFSDTEEAVVQHTDNVPFSIEDMYSEQGAKFEKEADFTSKVCTSELNGCILITGQNPQSSRACAEAALNKLGFPRS